MFGSFLIEAAGIPFPSRVVLIIAATLVERVDQLAGLIALSALGAVMGDHVPYAAGRLVGPRLLAMYCRLTLGSQRCVETTVGYFIRFGPAAILLSRFSAGVRIFASVLSGCGYVSYWRFVAWDIAGSVLYSTLWASLGHLVGEHVQELMRAYGGARVLLLIGPAAAIVLVGYRLWRRWRYGVAPAIDPAAKPELPERLSRRR